MSRPSDPPGVTYEGEAGVYTIRQSGRIKGHVWRAASRHSTWTATDIGAGRIRFTGPNRAAATAGLIGWLKEQT